MRLERVSWAAAAMGDTGVAPGTIADGFHTMARLSGEILLEREIRRAAVTCLVERRPHGEQASRFMFRDGSELILVESLHEPHPDWVPLLDEGGEPWPSWDAVFL